jgi:hypothetical protein
MRQNVKSTENISDRLIADLESYPYGRFAEGGNKVEPFSASPSKKRISNARMLSSK